MLIARENEKVKQISFLYKTGDIVKAYYKNPKGKHQIHCFAHLAGEPLVGIMNLDRNMTSFLTVEAVTDCEIVSISSIFIHRLAKENLEVALICNRMQGVSSLREYEYRKMILTCTPMQKYEYFLKGSNTMDKNHFISGKFTDAGQMFSYPELSVDDYE